MKELISVAQAALDYIDALPSDMVASLHTMPGFDRDWATEVIADAIVESNESRNRYSSSRRQFSCPRPVSLMARATQQKRISPADDVRELPGQRASNLASDTGKVPVQSGLTHRYYARRCQH